MHYFLRATRRVKLCQPHLENLTIARQSNTTTSHTPNFISAWLSLTSMNSPGSPCFVGLYQADGIINAHTHSPCSHVLWLNALPGEIVKVGHHARNPLTSNNLVVAFDKESENKNNKQQLLLLSLNGEKSFHLGSGSLSKNSCRCMLLSKTEFHGNTGYFFCSSLQVPRP